MVLILSLLVVASALAWGQTSPGGQIVGTVVDPAGAVVPNAQVSAFQTASNVIAGHAISDNIGQFKIGLVNAGSYTIKIRAQGWRTRALDRVVVNASATVSVGDIQLDLAGCDAPGVNCDIFSDDPKDFPPKPLSEGYVIVNPDCGVDLRKGKAYCPIGTAMPRTSDAVDLKIVKQDTRIYFTPSNGAAISAPNSSKTDCSDAKFSKANLRVDNLGPGYDICVRTHEGLRSHIFFVDDFINAEGEPTSSQIRFWQVTRRR
jgi:hypothetical protein